MHIYVYLYTCVWDEAVSVQVCENVHNLLLHVNNTYVMYHVMYPLIDFFFISWQL